MRRIPHCTAFRLVALLVGSGLMNTASAVDPKAVSLQQYSTALAAGRCAATMQLQRSVTSYGAPAQYTDDNSKLHFCQFVREIDADPTCLVGVTCPSYSVWSKANPEFQPDRPRAEFLAELEKRQALLTAMRRVAAQRAGTTK